MGFFKKLEEAEKIIKNGLIRPSWTYKQKEVLNLVMAALKKQKVYEGALVEIIDPNDFNDINDEVITKD